MSDQKKTKRRDFIVTASYALGAVGIGAAVLPLIDQMNPDASVKAGRACIKSPIEVNLMMRTLILRKLL